MPQTFCFHEDEPCATLPWPLPFGIFLEVIAVILAVVNFVLYVALYVSPTVDGGFNGRLAGYAKFARVKQSSAAVICPHILESIEPKTQEALFTKLGQAILRRIPQLKTARRYEAKIAQKMEQHICTTEKGCVQYERSGKGVQSSEGKPKVEKVDV
ncbi:hypothetical protein B0T21DRAFT_453687 [Apiosordaria backusii]|uniref:Uncharacterized protein n=1 Tax=Apiosordaria backusii TaxID=314023 RepID=A0AA40ASR8_9PEZI|nr:hypothetical protein B0T21DRAFT_453687 [Apiosordaria backusii]